MVRVKSGVKSKIKRTSELLKNNTVLEGIVYLSEKYGVHTDCGKLEISQYKSTIIEDENEKNSNQLNTKYFPSKKNWIETICKFKFGLKKKLKSVC